MAISRARCLAYLVCTEELLNSRARDVEEMRLISTLCAFVEWADHVRGDGRRQVAAWVRSISQYRKFLDWSRICWRCSA